MKPTIGRIVHYRLNEADAEIINRHRGGEHGHVGNRASAGEYCPAMVVRTFGEGAVVANLQVFLDGSDSYWATSRKEGDEPGTWAWPPRV